MEVRSGHGHALPARCGSAGHGVRRLKRLVGAKSKRIVMVPIDDYPGGRAGMILDKTSRD